MANEDEIPNDPLDPEMCGQVTHNVVCNTLNAAKGVDACRRCVTHVNRQIEAKFDQVRAEGMAIACAAGCSYCCHLRVSVLPHEAVALFSYLRSEIPRDQRQRIEARLVENAMRIKSMTREEHFATNITCAFLEESMCTVHPVRPSACSGYHSMDVDQCRYAFDHPDDLGDGKPTILELQVFGEMQQDASRAALERLGLVHGKIELHIAVEQLVRQPNMIERWGRGGVLVKGFSPDDQP
jgi:Fe-S-cluster containining protein